MTFTALFEIFLSLNVVLGLEYYAARADDHQIIGWRDVSRIAPTIYIYPQPYRTCFLHISAVVPTGFARFTMSFRHVCRESAFSPVST